MHTRSIGIVCLLLLSFSAEAVSQGSGSTSSKNALATLESDDPICQLVASEYADQRSAGSRDICTLVPAKSLSGFRRPAWRTLDARQHLDLIGQASVRREWDRGLPDEYVRSKGHLFEAASPAAAYGDLQKPIWMPPQIMAEVWTPLKAELLELIEAGKVWLQVATFDLNNDGALDTVYRVSPIPLRASRKPGRSYEIDRATLDSIWDYSVARDCVRQEGVLFLARNADADMRKSLYIYTPFLLDVTIRDGKTFLGVNSALLRPQTVADNPFYPEQICQFMPVR